MRITTIDIDLAKKVFQVHGVDVHGKTVLRKQLRRSKMAKFFANLEPCLIGMEACGGSHYCARKLGEFGHTARLMSQMRPKNEKSALNRFMIEFEE